MTKMCVCVCFFLCCGIVECVGKQFKVAELRKKKQETFLINKMTHNLI